MNRQEIKLNLSERALYGQYYAAEQSKAVVIIVHGMGEYGRRYERSVVPEFLKNSISVLSYDQFGHGKSDGKKGHHPGYELLLDSLDLMIDKTKELFEGLPVFLYGHSMGGNVVINYALNRPGKIKGLIVTSPFLRLSFTPPSWKLFLGKLMGILWPSITLPNELELEALSRDQNEITAYIKDPMVHDRVSYAYSIEFMDKGEWAIEHADQLQIPMLLLHGTADRLTDHKASEEFTQKAGNIVEYQPVEGGFHELHHDLDREVTIQKIITWIHET